MTSGNSLSPAARLYVSVPEDGRYGSELYPGSGQTVARFAQSAFQQRLGRVDRGQAMEGVDAALMSGRAVGADLVLVPVIAHWEDRATEWSGLPDRAEVLLTIYDAKTGAVVNRTSIQGRSTWFTFGGDHPQDLLPEPMNAYAASLF
ncbi:DUF4823 domain-containing protein [Pararoseomonas indoligenes]|uniref:DUF4823 domain-containing protein n=1 Tax=Roseomonas indoligenes TaxID=2820811 RepID=A0A940MXN3_9PROT|nr:DUF4823 domain-containing protein [Pararoseomonas indoligenes]MBP0494001.1 DUF4823 domain-containing protein [Pararoseomonas indoligenes]